jgi:hypothetical protein
VANPDSTCSIAVTAKTKVDSCAGVSRCSIVGAAAALKGVASFKCWRSAWGSGGEAEEETDGHDRGSRGHICGLVEALVEFKKV